ncbi:FadR/GntR family transcriptional regulator [Sphingomonas pseudosanguinis]|uniref:DNA-binding FadR family transcriptional regulator n=1 Tax=Sphingomonas pseudosanguinis TaxID=413712 RepID=A0A7W6AFQ8_9SPHN|nr:FadR/GntR family transcriptional regulator [Sphingomonas pseudosanguinis]MBB3880885.1 DNA-binding FadR family transcriptional regulator [Sphingomonas pseudosanguinis]MBN3535948.1 FadR family transcriptional regulator [Sphingomonas pseudosanguinis]
MAEKSENGRLYEQVARAISADILSGSYVVGQRLPSERDLAQAHSVSRPTVREAIIALELDGLVEVRMGSGVYVIASAPNNGRAGETDIGPFELLEARRAIESEVCALAATRIDDATLGELRSLVDMLESADVALAEEADQRFHETIARATQNSAMVASVEMLWKARARSPQYRLLSDKAHGAGVVPRLEDHLTIYEALAARNPDSARAAMRQHLTNVLEAILAATEVQELEEARARIAAHRQRYAV